MNEQLQTKRQLNPDLAHRRVLVDSLQATGTSQGIETVEADRFSGKRAMWLDPSNPLPPEVILDKLTLAQLRVGKSFLEIEHTVDTENRQKPYYGTSITNRSTEPIRIDRFGTYTLTDGDLILHTMTGGFFSPQQFQEWYDLGESEWIEPGQTVTDPNNHSKVGVYWTYFGTTASGQQFVAGALWGGKHWWHVW
jgi:hypothetical protein